MPAPPASASSAKTSRTSVTSTPSSRAIPPQTPASARSEVLAANAGRGMAGSWYGAVDPDRARADPGVDDQPALAPRRGDDALDLPAARFVAEDADVPGADPRLRIERDAGGDDDRRVTDVDAHLHRSRLVGGHRELREVEPHRADADLVRAAELGGTRHRDLAVADPVPDVDVEDRRGDRGRDEEQRDDGGEGDPDALEEPAYPAGVLARERDGLVGPALGWLGEAVAREDEDRDACDR